LIFFSTDSTGQSASATKAENRVRPCAIFSFWSPTRT
jgi:hypothetical protein